MKAPKNLSFRWLDKFLTDVRYAFRMAEKHRGFTVLVVLTMALGIGAATATFSILDAVLIRPLPYNNGSRLVAVYMTVPSFRSNPALSKIWDRLGPNLSDFQEFRKRQTTFDNVAAIRSVGAFLEADEKRRVQLGTVSTNFFSTLGVKPAYGRLFSVQEEKPNATPTAVLSRGIWERAFGSDPLVLGRLITVQHQQGREQYVVIGVLPSSFEFGDYGIDDDPSPDVWLSTAASKGEDADFNVVATLKKGVPLSEAEREAASIFDSGLDSEGRKLFGSVGAWVTPLQKEQAQNIRTALFILAASAGLLLFIACGNVANLLLAQGSARSHEMALRAAVGARRGRIVRQLLTESAVLFLCGGAVGILLAHWSVRALVRLSPVAIPRVNEIGVDGRALLFALTVSAITGIVFGLGPAFLATRADLNETLKRTANHRGTPHQAQGLVIVAEISLSFVLLIAAGLLTQTLFRLLSESNRMHAEHLLSVHADLSGVQFKGNVDFVAFANAALQRIQSLPDVTISAISTPAPFAGRTVQAIALEGSEAGEPAHLLDNRAVTKDYFRTLEIPIVAGRQFTESDMAAPGSVVIVNQTMAKQLWSTDTAVNKRIRWTEDSERNHWMTVVGVCSDVLDLQGSGGKALPIFYVPLQQGRGDLTFLIRAGGEPTRLSRSVRQGILDVEKGVTIDRVDTLDTLLRTSLAGERYRAVLINLFAATAAALALIGLYGVISRFVAIRTRELSIRMALGAQSIDVLRYVLQRSLLLTSMGIGIGITVAAASTQWLSGLLFGVHALDLPTFAGVGLSLIAVAVLATYIPARRAASIDPMIALRSE